MFVSINGDMSRVDELFEISILCRYTQTYQNYFVSLIELTNIPKYERVYRNKNNFNFTHTSVFLYV